MGVTWRRCEGCGFEVRSGPWSVDLGDLERGELGRVEAYRSGVCAHFVGGHWFCVWCADIWDEDERPLYGAAGWRCWWADTPREDLIEDCRYRAGTRSWRDADEGVK